MKATYKYCAKCPFHVISPDPDPHDWFCDDDVKISCGKKLDKYRRETIIDVAVRPYQVSKVESPSWCPLKK